MRAAIQPGPPHSMHRAHIDVETVDSERIAAVSNALGAQRFGELLTVLSTRLQRLSSAIEALPANAQDIASVLHQSRGSTASLGLVGLTAALTDMEAQIARVLSGSATLPDPTRLACIKIVGRALGGYWRAASQAAAGHVPATQAAVEQDQASGICIK